MGFQGKHNTAREFVLEQRQLEVELLSLPTAPTSVGKTERLQWLHNLGIRATIATQSNTGTTWQHILSQCTRNIEKTTFSNEVFNY